MVPIGSPMTGMIFLMKSALHQKMRMIMILFKQILKQGVRMMEPFSFTTTTWKSYTNFMKIPLLLKKQLQ